VGLLGRIRAHNAAARVRRDQEAAEADRRYQEQSAAAARAAAMRHATRTIADQVRRHPLDVTALGVTVRDDRVITPAGTWRLRGTRATVSGYSAQYAGPYRYRTARHSALLAVTGPYGHLFELPLSHPDDIRAARMLSAHLNARSAAVRLPRR